MAIADQFAIPITILRHFDLSSSPWSSQAEIFTKRRERSSNGKLFFDRLLEIAGIDGPSLYPPKSPADVRRLLHSIQSTELDRLKKDCYFYYLLLDYDGQSEAQKPNGHVEGMDVDDEDAILAVKTVEATKVAGKFARRRCMPRNWKIFIDGYWALDHGLWEIAVDKLSDPSISEVNFVSEIVQSLSTSVSPPQLACSLLHSFFLSTQPNFPNPSFESDVRLIATASATSIFTALGCIRQESSPEQRKRMREVVWSWMLGAPRTPCGAGNHVVQSKALKELTHAPLFPEEETHLIEFLSHPPRSIPSPALSQLHDLMTLRLIHQGHYNQVFQLDKKLAGNGAGTQGDKQKRREMVREFISILPETHRRVLLADVEGNLRRGEEEINGFSEDVDMAGSWLQVDGVEEPTPAPAFTLVSGSLSMTVPASVPAPVAIASTPIRSLPSSSNVVRPAHVASVGSPSQRPERTHSPFGGPPRFAQGATVSSSSPRQSLAFTGSPFSLPQKTAAAKTHGSSEKPRPKMVINDDQEAEETLQKEPVRGKGKGVVDGKGGLRRSTRRISMSVEPEELPVDENHPIEPIAEDTAWSPSHAVVQEPKSTRKGGRKTRDKTPPMPVSPSRRSTRARKRALDPLATDDEPLARRTRGASVHPEPSATPATRGRMTRSVSRALLEDSDHETVDVDMSVPPSKRNGTAVPGSISKKRRGSVATSEITDDGLATVVETPRVRRSNRKAAPSPTPSVQGSEAGKIRRKKENAAPTPRMATRSRRV
ncbi:hypothetical protein C349_01371 [Cryptococcus neoformans var. grubii Br795]|nr:hypothetical protein C349_01371 [Cryptococcus neoformans var. grubii Br795]